MPKTKAHSPTKTVRRLLSSKRSTLPAIPPTILPEPRSPGRQFVVATPEELDAGVILFVQECERIGQPITLSGMAYFLGFDDKDSLRLQAEREGFARSVKRALAVVERTYEDRLHGKDCIGAIFALKNMGWTDRQDINVRGVIAGIDLDKFSDEQLQRVRAGAHPLQVMQEVKFLPPPA